MTRARFATLAAGALGGITGCARDVRDTSIFRVAMVTDTGGLGDRSFNDAAYAGLQAARARLHVRATLVQSRAAIDYQTNLSLVASTGYDEIIAIGYSLELDLAEVAKRFGDRHFAIIDGLVDAPNVSSVGFREQEGSFLAGVLAARTTATKRIAFLGGIDVPELRKFEAGFRAGARQIDPSIAVAVKYIGSYDDVAGGRELSALLYAGGADIIFVAAGKAGLGTILESLRRTGAYVIGVDSDQDGDAPGKILTSVLKRIDRSVFEVCRRAQAHALPLGIVSLGLKEGGVGLTDFRFSRHIIGAATIALIERYRTAIVDGRLAVPFTREGLSEFKRATRV